MGNEIVGGTDYLFKFRLPNGNAYLTETDLASLYVAIVGETGIVYDKFSLILKTGYLKLKATGVNKEWFELYISTAKTAQIATSGDTVKAQINIIQNETDTALIADGKRNTVVYIDLPEIIKPLVEVEPS